MTQQLIPDSFLVPEEYKTDDFFIRKLTTRDVYLDYVAVMSSIDNIKNTRGGSWPTKDLTLEDDLIDLGWHQREFENRSSFAYTVFTPENDKCLGCFYFYPPGYRKEVDNTYDVDVSFWVTQEAYNEGLYEKLYATIQVFLKDWPFKKPYWSNTLLPN